MTDEGGDLLSIGRDLQELERDSQRGPRIVNDAFIAWQEAKREYDVAKAHAYLRAKQSGKPTIPEIEALVELDTIVERTNLDRAKAAHQYAADRTEDIAERRSSLQTRSKLVMEQMRLAGHS